MKKLNITENRNAVRLDVLNAHAAQGWRGGLQLTEGSDGPISTDRESFMYVMSTIDMAVPKLSGREEAAIRQYEFIDRTFANAAGEPVAISDTSSSGPWLIGRMARRLQYTLEDESKPNQSFLWGRVILSFSDIWAPEGWRKRFSPNSLYQAYSTSHAVGPLFAAPVIERSERIDMILAHKARTSPEFIDHRLNLDWVTDTRYHVGWNDINAAHNNDYSAQLAGIRQEFEELYPATK